MLIAEAGLGKTTLVRTALESAEVQGFTTFYGRAEPSERHRPHAAWEDALHSAKDPSGREIGKRIGGLLDLAGEPGDRNRAEEFVESVRNAAVDGPIAFALEDLHDADPETLALTTLLVRRLRTSRVHLLLSTRPIPHGCDSELAALTQAIQSAPGGALVELQPLAMEEIAELLADVEGAEPAPGVLDAVYEQCLGNPFYAIEMLRSMASSPQRAENGVVSLLDRVFREAPAERAVGRAVALLGSARLDHLPLIEVLAELDAASVATAFDSLVARSILVSESRAGFRFQHPIIADHLYRDMGPAIRHRAHDVALQWLRSQTTVDGPQMTLEIARHAMAVASPGDLGAIEAATRASEAVRDVAPLVAAQWVARVIELIPTPDERVGDLHARRARLLWKGSRPREAAKAGVRALELLPEGILRAKTARSTLASLYTAGRVELASSVAQREIERGTDSVTLASQSALLLAESGRVAEGVAAAERLQESIEHCSNEDRAIALINVGLVAYIAGDGAKGLACAEALSNLVPRLAPHSLPSVLESAAWLFCLFGRPRRANQELERSDAYPCTNVNVAGVRDGTVVRSLWQLGRWSEAMTEAQRASSELDAVGLEANSIVVRSVQAAIALERSDLRQATELLATLDSELESDAGTIAGLRAGALAAQGFHTAAFEEAESSWQTLRARGTLGGGTAHLLDRTIQLAVRLQSGVALEYLEALGHVAQRSESIDAQSAEAAWRVSLVGDLDAGEQARAVAQAEGMVFDVARLDLALGIAGSGGEHRLPRALLTFVRLGSVDLAARARSEIRRAGLVMPNTGTTPHGLTEREAHLSGLVAQGMSNKQIASAMSLSVKTVEVYLTRIYRKVQVESRLQLANLINEQPEMRSP